MSVSPVRVRERCLIKLVSEQIPLRQRVIHYAPETLVVTGFNQVCQFVHHDVFCTYERFLCEFEIQPDPAYYAVCRYPIGFSSF